MVSVKLNQLSKYFGPVKAVDNLNLQIRDSIIYQHFFYLWLLETELFIVP